jgi:hypothetical protein
MPSWSVVERDAPTPDRGQLLIEATRCYQNLADTMRRIPFGSNANGVFDNLVEVPQNLATRPGKHDLVIPDSIEAGGTLSPAQVIGVVARFRRGRQLRPRLSGDLGGAC